MLIKEVQLSDLYPIIDRMIREDGKVTISVSGYSMQPMLYNKRDTVTITKPEFPLKKYDIPFFRLDDGRFVLHRIIKVYSDGTYKCRGDNRWEAEDHIRNNQIIGVVESFNRNGKTTHVDNSFGYWIYTRSWKFLHPFKKYYKYFYKMKNYLKIF